MIATEDFAGPGGFSTALQRLGIGGTGYEWNANACATAEAAGHRRVKADVTTHTGDRTTHIYCGGPPCQGFSLAGLGAGRRDDAQAAIFRGIAELGAGGVNYQQAAAHVTAVCHDERVPLVLWPLYFALVERPRTIVLEQVRAVLPIWQAVGGQLRRHGYHVATGVLSAEQYDVPQTRVRAFLLASLDGPVRMPPPVRRKYRKGVAQHEGDPALLPWLSMADALGWPAGLVGFPRLADTPSNRAGNDIVTLDGVDYRGRDLFPTDRPAPAVTGKSRSWQRWPYERPATTVQGDPRIWPPGHKVNADDRRRHADADERYGDRAGTNAIRVSVQEAAVLQGFPPDYPWQGTKTAQYQQVGDAVPPPLAWHVIRAALRMPVAHYPDVMTTENAA